MKKKSFWILTLCLACVELLIHFLTATNYELHRDEMLYFSMGNHVSWGFASTPPLMSVMSFVIHTLFGYHEFWVKLFPALAGALLIVIIALFIRELGGRESAVFTGCFGYLISTGMLRPASLFQPVIFELLFWSLLLFFVLKLINTQNQKYWLLVGISFGLAFINKYSVLFLGGAVFLGLILSEHRRLLFSRYLFYGIIAGLIIMAPNILWQIKHNFAVATHMKELYRTQLVFVSVKTFLLEQLMMNFPAIIIWMTGLAGVLFFRKEKKYRLFGYIFCIVVILFLIAKGKPYYTLGLYPTMIAFGGYFVIKYLSKQLIPILAVSTIVAVFLLPFGLPVLPQVQMARYCTFFSKYITPAPMRSENNAYYPIPQDYMDMTGWNELAKLASVAYNQLDPQQKKSCIIYANNYGQAGALDFYGKRYNLPSPVCVNDSYIFWAPDSLSADNFVVTDNHIGDIPEIFGNYKQIGEIDNIYFRENGLKVYLCQHPKPLMNEFFKNRIKANKKIYGY